MAIVNSVIMYIVVHVSFSILALSGYKTVVVLLGHMVVLFLIFFKEPPMVFHGGYINLHSHQQQKDLLFSTLSPAFIVCIIFKILFLIAG